MGYQGSPFATGMINALGLLGGIMSPLSDWQPGQMAIGPVLSNVAKQIAGQQLARAQRSDNQAVFKQATGMDLSGYSDPEKMQKYVADIQANNQIPNAQTYANGGGFQMGPYGGNAALGMLPDYLKQMQQNAQNSATLSMQPNAYGYGYNQGGNTNQGFVPQSFDTNQPYQSTFGPYADTSYQAQQQFSQQLPDNSQGQPIQGGVSQSQQPSFTQPPPNPFFAGIPNPEQLQAAVNAGQTGQNNIADQNNTATLNQNRLQDWNWQHTDRQATNQTTQQRNQWENQHWGRQDTTDQQKANSYDYWAHHAGSGGNPMAGPNMQSEMAQRGIESIDKELSTTFGHNKDGSLRLPQNVGQPGYLRAQQLMSQRQMLQSQMSQGFPTVGPVSGPETGTPEATFGNQGSANLNQLQQQLVAKYR